MSGIDSQNPWLAAAQTARVWAVYQPHVAVVLHWLAPFSALAWVVASGLGRSVVLRRIDPSIGARLAFRPMRMMVLQGAWLALLGATCWAWYCAMGWVAAAHISAGAEPDLIGFAIWTIFLGLGFFTAWALLSWPLSIAPLLMLLEDRGPGQSLLRAFRLGKAFTAKLVEINLVMGIVNLALIVVAMVFSAAPLPFSDELGSATLNFISLAAVVFYLVATDYFQLVRLKGFVEFWKMFRGERLAG